MISAHPGYDGTVNSGAAGAKQHDGRDQQGVVGIALTGDQFGQELSSVFNTLSQVRCNPQNGAQDQGQYYGRHVLHLRNGRNADAHGADAENQVQLLLELLRQLLAAKRANHTAQGHSQHITYHSNGHVCILRFQARIR